MQLVIAEKPSVATDLAKVLPGKFTQQEGYWEGSDHLITWAVGHLLQLAEPEDYDPELKVWQLSSLPIIPDELAGGFKRRPRSGQTKQLRLIKKLANRKDVTTLVNACDAAREGELIFREIEEFVDSGKPVKRLWLQSMTAKSIEKAFGELRPGSDFSGLSDAAYSRSEADWLIGMNATRGITKRLKGRRERGVWSAGRVQTPTLALLVHKELSVLAHVPIPYWKVQAVFEANGHDYKAQYRSTRSGKDSEKLWEQDTANQISKTTKGATGEVSEKVSQSQRKPPALFSLTALQKEANSRFGMSARRTLGAAQRLYEAHKSTTYPRTDFSALPDDYREHVAEVVAKLAAGEHLDSLTESGKLGGIKEAAALLQRDGLLNQKRNFDDAKVRDHFAIIPTGTMPSSPLGGDDAKIFEMIMRRFLAAFMGPSTWERVVRETRIVDTGAPNGHWSFFTESSRIAVPGWQAVDRVPKPSELLGELGVAGGEVVGCKNLEVEVEEDQTRPPARYTEGKLLKAMEEASDLELDIHDDFDDEDALTELKSKGLGTPATRADIIESLIAKGYVGRSGKTLRASAKGITLIDFLERIHADDLAKAELTAEMEFHLRQVEQGARTRESFMQEVTDSVRDLVARLSSFNYEDLYTEEKPVGICPRDGYPIIEGLKGYRCARVARGDTFDLALKGLGKESSVPIAEAAEQVGAKLSAADDISEVEVNAKRVNATLIVKFAEIAEVPILEKRLEELLEGAAPAGSLKDHVIKVIEPDACAFTVWKEFRGRYINRPIAEKLISERDSGPIEGFVSMRGDFYAGKVLLNDELKLEFEAVKGFKTGDDDSAVAPELVSFIIDSTPFVVCPKCGSQVVETATHFECQKDGEKGCGVIIPRAICKREMSRADLATYFDPEQGHTDWIEDFISRKGRPFTARLVRQENGRHTFEFKPRAAGAGKKKGAKKKVGKKKSAKKKTATEDAGE
ncbi:MAG: hypothetical protein COB96_01285 [Planctomycetota bacterium]|nr:MAG: hypothetical protein COB96_01285 [Planctomycetota bacterium]